MLSKLYTVRNYGCDNLKTAALILLILYTANILAVLFIIFTNKRSSASSLTWLLFLMFVPIFGFVFYFFIGSTSKISLLSRRYRQPSLESSYLRISENYFDGEKLCYDSTTNGIIRLNLYSALSKITYDNDATVLVNAQQKFPLLLKELENAKQSINILYFIFKPDDKIGAKIIDILCKKASEGVKVRFVYDCMGYLPSSALNKTFLKLEKSGVLVCRHLPSLLKSFIQVNYRMHRKIVVIDGKIAYTGGINIGDDYLGEYPKITPWRDTSVRLTGSCVNAVQLRFLTDWIFIQQQKRNGESFTNEQIKEFFPPPLKQSDIGVQIISSGPDSKRGHIRDCYFKIISSAKNYIYIQTPYFAPDETLLDAIIICAKSGVDIRIMLPGIPDKKMIYNVTLSYVNDLLDAGVKVYFHEGFIHAKTFVSDDFITSIGTTNLDIRSFKLDYEINAVIYDRSFALENKNIFLKDIEQCREAELKEFKNIGFFKKILHSVCKLFSPLV